MSAWHDPEQGWWERPLQNRHQGAWARGAHLRRRQALSREPALLDSADKRSCSWARLHAGLQFPDPASSRSVLLPRDAPPDILKRRPHSSGLPFRYNPSSSTCSVPAWQSRICSPAGPEHMPFASAPQSEGPVLDTGVQGGPTYKPRQNHTPGLAGCSHGCRMRSHGYGWRPHGTPQY